jgi:hypothetical protein
MKQQRMERVRSFNGSLTHEHMMSMERIKSLKMFVETREREREVLTDSFFLLISTLWIVCDE